MKTRFLLLVWAIVTLSISSCQKDDTDGGGGTGTPSRFEGFESCVIIAPPSAVELNSFYSKYLNCSGIPVIGGPNVPNEAFMVANETMEFMFVGLDAVRNKLIERGEYFILTEPGELPGDLPEFSSLSGQSTTGIYWDQARAGSSNSAGLLCFVEDNVDGHQNVFLHEMAHMMCLSGFRHVEPDFGSELASIYSNAMSSGMWANTYSATNKEEYFATGMQVYFEVGFPFGPAGGDGNWNDITTRAELQQRDPMLHQLIASRFNSSLDVPGCIQGEDYQPYVDPNINCGTSVTDIDNNTYGVVHIGNQCWMTENLKTTRYKDGTPIPEVTDDTQWSNLTTGARSVYNNDGTNFNTFGQLYNWEAINSTAGICPDGWHVATKTEWQVLMAFAATSGNGTAGDLKATTLWTLPNDGATNATGFSALPAGVRNEDGFFGEINTHTSFWSATSDNGTHAWSFHMWNNGDFTGEGSDDKARGKSCRCVKD